MPRIISGKAKGIPLETPKGMKTRPTSDRAKEALFSILSDIYIGGNVLDLYSGTGSLGLETLSRGARKCIFIDKNRQAVAVIKENIKKTRLEDGAKVFCADAVKAMDFEDVNGTSFSLIVMDPPYNKRLLLGAIEKISENDIMEKNGMLVVEHSDSEVPPERMAGFDCTSRRKYGAVNFSFYKLAGHGESKG